MMMTMMMMGMTKNVYWHFHHKDRRKAHDEIIRQPTHEATETANRNEDKQQLRQNVLKGQIPRQRTTRKKEIEEWTTWSGCPFLFLVDHPGNKLIMVVFKLITHLFVRIHLFTRIKYSGEHAVIGRWMFGFFWMLCTSLAVVVDDALLPDNLVRGGWWWNLLCPSKWRQPHLVQRHKWINKYFSTLINM